MQGIVTNIQRFSVHDGPGIRTTVFLKGCNLRCFWCHNPEDINPKPEIQFFPERCILCAACVESCVHAAHSMDNGDHIFQRERCTACGDCIDACYAKAVVLVGETVSGGGRGGGCAGPGVLCFVRWRRDLSGGEPLLQLDFSCVVLARCRELGIHTAIETSCQFPWSRLASILPHVDLVMMDIKHMDSRRHRQSTGVPNERILENAASLGRQPQPLIIRTPVIPGVNDAAEDIAAIAEFVVTLPNLLYYELLPYHPMADSKYRSLDRPNRCRLGCPPRTRWPSLSPQPLPPMVVRTG